MKLVVFILFILFTSCSSYNYINEVRVKYPHGEIYMINSHNFLVINNDAFYHVMYFKGEVYIEQLHKYAF